MDMVQKKEKIITNKCLGPDEIHPRLLKELSLLITAPLAKLFQHSLEQGAVPNDWEEANITVFYKR